MAPLSSRLLERFARWLELDDWQPRRRQSQEAFLRQRKEALGRPREEATSRLLALGSDAEPRPEPIYHNVGLRLETCDLFALRVFPLGEASSVNFNQRNMTAAEARALADELRHRAASLMQDLAVYGGTFLTPPDDLESPFLVEGKAGQRGMELLKRWLTPKQRAQFESHGCFEVVGCHSGASYEIGTSATFNVIRLGTGRRRREKICFEPAGRLVTGDRMLAQKIALETREREALAVANRLPWDCF